MVVLSLLGVILRACLSVGACAALVFILVKGYADPKGWKAVLMLLEVGPLFCITIVVASFKAWRKYRQYLFGNPPAFKESGRFRLVLVSQSSNEVQHQQETVWLTHRNFTAPTTPTT